MLKDYIVLDINFNGPEDIKSVEEKYHLCIKDVTKFHSENCDVYRGPNMYLCIGEWRDLFMYLIDEDGYALDKEMLLDYLNDIDRIRI